MHPLAAILGLNYFNKTPSPLQCVPPTTALESSITPPRVPLISPLKWLRPVLFQRLVPPLPSAPRAPRENEPYSIRPRVCLIIESVNEIEQQFREVLQVD